MKNDILNIGGESFHSRLFVGTGKFSSGESLQRTIENSATELVTVAMKRASPNGSADSIIDFIPQDRVKILPNTSGVRDAKEAIFVAQMAREALDPNWLKLEIHPDPK
ncbi:MAG: thiazole synthase, partial [Bdellovibrionota bacterium]